MQHTKCILNVCHDVKCIFQIGEGEVSIAPRCLVHQTCDVLLLSVTCARPRRPVSFFVLTADTSPFPSLSPRRIEMQEPPVRPEVQRCPPGLNLTNVTAPVLRARAQEPLQGGHQDSAASAVPHHALRCFESPLGQAYGLRPERGSGAVSYTHLTLPKNREV